MARFVPTTGVPELYRNAKDSKNVLEYKLVYGAMLQTAFSPFMDTWHVQGMYMITPSGKVLAGSNNTDEASAVARDMDLALEKYAKLTREERLLPKAPDPLRDRVPSDAQTLHPPTDGLILRMVSRGLPTEGLTLKDTRHEFYYKLDRVWFTREESRSFVPSQIKVGAKEAVKRSTFNRLVLLHLGVFVQPNLCWQPEDIKEEELSTEITGMTEEDLDVRFSGRVRLLSGTYQRSFEADLLGQAKYMPQSQSFSTFELLAVGIHTLGPKENLPEGAPRSAPMGVLFTLNGTNPNDREVPYFHHLYDWASKN